MVLLRWRSILLPLTFGHYCSDRDLPLLNHVILVPHFKSAVPGGASSPPTPFAHIEHELNLKVVFYLGRSTKHALQDDVMVVSAVARICLTSDTIIDDRS